MFSREQPQTNGLKKWVAAALVAGCAVGSFWLMKQDQTQPVSEATLLETIEREFDEEVPLEDEMMNLAGRHNRETCDAIRETADIAPPGMHAYKNMEAILRGYNVFKGSPFAKSDQGFGSRLFTLDWRNPVRDSHGWYRPRDTNVMNQAKCSSSTSSMTSLDEHDLQENYSSTCSSDVGITGVPEFTAKFTGSTEYKHDAHTVAKGEQGTAYATASCISFTYSLQKVLPPCMSNELLEFVDVMMEDMDEDETMTEFFDSFGTHAIMSMEMGDKFVAKTTFSSKEYIKNKQNGGHLTFDADMGFFTFVTAKANHNTQIDHDDQSNGQSRMDASEMYTIGTPLPDGANVAEKLDAWIADKKARGETAPQPVGHMNLVPLSNVLKYTFRQEGFSTPEHKQLLTLLKLHNDKPYCESLVARGLIDTCAAAKKAVRKQIKRRSAGHPIEAEAGEDAECEDHGVFTEVCGAGSYPTCNGHYTYGRCEKFDIRPDEGYWKRINRSGQYGECRTGAITKLCTSGDSKDCNDGKDTQSIFCNTSMKVNKKRGHCQYRLQASGSGMAKCKKNQVMVGRAASTGNPDASLKGRHVFGWIKCCDAITPPHMYTVGDKL